MPYSSSDVYTGIYIKTILSLFRRKILLVPVINYKKYIFKVQEILAFC